MVENNEKYDKFKCIHESRLNITCQCKINDTHDEFSNND